jgi:PAS domain S-box-containing protein
MNNDKKFAYEAESAADQSLPGSMRVLRERAEAQALVKIAHSAKRIAMLSPDEVRGLMHELNVHQIELEMQNDELRLTQNELETALARYFELYDLAPVGYCSLSETGRLLQVNQLVANLLGCSQQALVTRPFAHFLHPDDRDSEYLLRRRILTSRTNQSCEWRLLDQHGTPIWVHAQAVVRIEAGGVPVFHMVLTNIDELKQAHQALQTSLGEKEALLKEVHHRVKNNLQVISSLLSLESRRTDATAIKTVLDEMQGRIHSMALLHETLYRSGVFAAVDLAGYLKHLSAQVFRAQLGESANIQLHLQLASIEVSMDQAVPCGLLINELLSNCLKHAFPEGRSGAVWVSLHVLDEDRRLRLSVRDDGVGLPADFILANSQTLGLQLVNGLVQQLGGSLNLSNDPGCLCSLEFTAAQP